MRLTPQDVLGDHPAALAAFQRVSELLAEIGPSDVRSTPSQVAFRRRRGFAYLWCPGRYLANPKAEVVLSIAIPEARPSPRWKEVHQSAPSIWMHHLELHDPPADLDSEVASWLRAAWENAA